MPINFKISPPNLLASHMSTVKELYKQRFKEIATGATVATFTAQLAEALEIGIASGEDYTHYLNSLQSNLNFTKKSKSISMTRGSNGIDEPSQQVFFAHQCLPWRVDSCLH